MTFTPTPFFYISIGFILGMLIGWAIGFFDSNNRSAKKIQAAESKAEIKIKEAEKKIAQAAQQSTPAPQSAQKPQDDPGLLRLKTENGQIKLEMDGALIDNTLSADKRKRLVELVTILRPWIEGGQSPQPIPQSAVSNAPVFAPVQSTDSRPVSLTTPASRKPEAELNIKSLSIVQQIDAVLQARLADSPLAKRGIRLQESPQGGVEVYVGLEKFSTVEDVTNEVIKAAIRSAIAEWEEKYTPG